MEIFQVIGVVVTVCFVWNLASRVIAPRVVTKLTPSGHLQRIYSRKDGLEERTYFKPANGPAFYFSVRSEGATLRFRLYHDRWGSGVMWESSGYSLEQSQRWFQVWREVTGFEIEEFLGKARSFEDARRALDEFQVRCSYKAL